MCGVTVEASMQPLELENNIITRLSAAAGAVRAMYLVSFTAFANSSFAAVPYARPLRIAFLINYCNYFSLNLILQILCHYCVSPRRFGFTVMRPLTPLRLISDHVFYHKYCCFGSYQHPFKFILSFFKKSYSISGSIGAKFHKNSVLRVFLSRP